MIQLPGVAKKVFYMCKKCEVDRYQVVTTHASLTSARLQCEVCKSKNLFTLDAPKRTTKPKVAKRKVNAQSVAAQSKVKWTELCGTQDTAPAPYTMKGQFETGVTVKHPKFGVGFVIGSTGQAIQVLFEDGERALVHNRG